MADTTDNDTTPKANRTLDTTAADNRTSDIALRKSSATSKIDVPTTSTSYVTLPTSSSVVASTDSSRRASDCIPPLAPLAKRRFPIDGYEKVWEAAGKSSWKSFANLSHVVSQKNSDQRNWEEWNRPSDICWKTTAWSSVSWVSSRKKCFSQLRAFELLLSDYIYQGRFRCQWSDRELR